MIVILNTVPRGFQIDSTDYHLIRNRSIHLAGKGYVLIQRKTKSEKNEYLHRKILNAPKGLHVDHINGDKLDNRRSNIRLVTRSQNNANSAPMAGKRFKGIYLDKRRGLFAAEITPFMGKKKRFLGYFKAEEDAAMAYDRAAAFEFGEHARFNFPIHTNGGEA